jgi:hypothetical protein
MMMKLRLTVLLLMITTVLFAQQKYADHLVLRQGKTITCQVREIGDDEIKYVVEGYRDDLVFGIDKNKVERIIFGDGREIEVFDSMFGAENYADQRKDAFKFHFFSPLSNATAISYERSLKPGRSVEATLGIIGLGIEEMAFSGDEDASGVNLKLGYKFIKDPDFYLKGMRYAHLLKGAYFKPELAFASYTYTPYEWLGNNQTRVEENVFVAALILNVGKQWIFSNRFLVDFSVGGGYGFGSNDSGASRHYGFTGADGDIPLVVTSSFSIGFLL